MNFYKSILQTLFSNWFALAISFVGSVILTRSLGAEGRGLIAWVIALTSIGSIFAQAGMGHANRRFSVNRHHRVPALFSINLITCCIFSLITMVVLWFIGINETIGDNNRLLLLIALLIIPITAIGNTMNGLLIGIGKDKEFSLLAMIEKVSNTILIVVLVMIDFITPFTAVIALLLSSLLRLLFIIYALRHHIYFKIKNIHHIYKHLASFTFFNYIANSLSTLPIHIIGVFLGILSTLQETGFYATNIIIITAICQLSIVIEAFSMRKIITINNLQERFRTKVTISMITFLASLCISCVMFYSAEWIVPIIFGNNFIAGIQGFKILVIGVPFSILLRVLQSFISAETKGFLIIVSPTVLLVVTIILSFILISQYGSLGASYAWGIANFIACILSLFFTFKKLY